MQIVQEVCGFEIKRGYYHYEKLWKILISVHLFYLTLDSIGLGKEIGEVLMDLRCLKCFVNAVVIEYLYELESY